MQRAWPFENHVDPEPPIRSPEDFVRRHGRGVEAVVVRIGLNGAQLVIVSETGEWDRWVLPSTDSASEAAEALGVPVHVGEFPEALRVRMNSRQRPAADFDRRAYPEQGTVGSVRPYAENRPRRLARDEGGGPAN